MRITRGDDIVIDIVFTDETTGLPMDITGATVFFTVKKIGDVSENDDTALIQKDQDTHVAPTEGHTTIDLTNTDTSIPAGTYEYDFQVKDSSNNIMSTLSSKLIVEKDITRRTS